MAHNWGEGILRQAKPKGKIEKSRSGVGHSSTPPSFYAISPPCVATLPNNWSTILFPTTKLEGRWLKELWALLPNEGFFPDLILPVYVSNHDDDLCLPYSIHIPFTIQHKRLMKTLMLHQVCFPKPLLCSKMEVLKATFEGE